MPCSVKSTPPDDDPPVRDRNSPSRAVAGDPQKEVSTVTLWSELEHDCEQYSDKFVRAALYALAMLGGTLLTAGLLIVVMIFF